MEKDNIGEYVVFIDSAVNSYVPDPIENPDLFKLGTTYWLHSHSRSVGKYKVIQNHVHIFFEKKFFADHTFITIPVDINLPEDVRNDILI